MATTTMRLGLLLILAVAIIQISKGEKEDESQMEQKSEGNMMASSMEEVELRTVREAGKNKQKKCGIKCRRKGGSNKKRRCNKKKCKRERKNNKKGKKKGSKKRTRKTKPTKKGKKGKKQGKKGKEGKEDLKKKKRTKKFKKNPNISVRQTCDEAALCQKIKDYIKYSNQLRKVKRIVKSCDTMEKKANKSATEFDATVAALDEVIASNAKRRLYIRWRRTQRSTDEVVAIRDNLKNCSVSAKAKCEKKVEPACLETALHTECEASLQAWLNSFGPSKGSCLQASADCCACITALPTVDAKCLDFDTKSTNAVASKKKCTGGTETGSFGFCRKQQQEASVKGPPAACGGSTATKAPPSATTAAGATTAAPAGDNDHGTPDPQPPTDYTPYCTTGTGIIPHSGCTGWEPPFSYLCPPHSICCAQPSDPGATPCCYNGTECVIKPDYLPKCPKEEWSQLSACMPGSGGDDPCPTGSICCQDLSSIPSGSPCCYNGTKCPGPVTLPSCPKEEGPNLSACVPGPEGDFTGDFPCPSGSICCQDWSDLSDGRCCYNETKCPGPDYFFCYESPPQVSGIKCNNTCPPGFSCCMEAADPAGVPCCYNDTECPGDSTPGEVPANPTAPALESSTGDNSNGTPDPQPPTDYHPPYCGIENPGIPFFRCSPPYNYSCPSGSVCCLNPSTPPPIPCCNNGTECPGTGNNEQ